MKKNRTIASADKEVFVVVDNAVDAVVRDLFVINYFVYRDRGLENFSRQMEYCHFAGLVSDVEVLVR